MTIMAQVLDLEPLAHAPLDLGIVGQIEGHIEMLARVGEFQQSFNVWSLLVDLIIKHSLIDSPQAIVLFECGCAVTWADCSGCNVGTVPVIFCDDLHKATAKAMFDGVRAGA